MLSRHASSDGRDMWICHCQFGSASFAWSILAPLLIMAVAFMLLFVTLHLAAMRNEILRRRVRALQMMQASQHSA